MELLNKLMETVASLISIARWEKQSLHITVILWDKDIVINMRKQKSSKLPKYLHII